MGEWGWLGGIKLFAATGHEGRASTGTVGSDGKKEAVCFPLILSCLSLPQQNRKRLLGNVFHVTNT